MQNVCRGLKSVLLWVRDRRDREEAQRRRANGRGLPRIRGGTNSSQYMLINSEVLPYIFRVVLIFYMCCIACVCVSVCLGKWLWTARLDVIPVILYSVVGLAVFVLPWNPDIWWTCWKKRGTVFIASFFFTFNVPLKCPSVRKENLLVR